MVPLKGGVYIVHVIKFYFIPFLISNALKIIIRKNQACWAGLVLVFPATKM